MKINELENIPTPTARRLPGYDPQHPLHTTWSRLISRQKYQAARDGKTYNIPLDLAWAIIVKQEWACALSGQKFTPGGTRVNTQPSLDRINSSLGYEPGNIQYVTYRVNLTKRELSDNDFITLCKQVAAYR